MPRRWGRRRVEQRRSPACAAWRRRVVYSDCRKARIVAARPVPAGWRVDGVCRPRGDRRGRASDAWSLKVAARPQPGDLALPWWGGSTPRTATSRQTWTRFKMTNTRASGTPFGARPRRSVAPILAASFWQAFSTDRLEGAGGITISAITRRCRASETQSLMGGIHPDLSRSRGSRFVDI